MNKATDKQVGGELYQTGYQPVELFAKLNLNAFQANVVKYVCRYRRKNGIEDLRKAIHYCELAEQLSPIHILTRHAEEIKREIRLFAVANKLSGIEAFIVSGACFSSWSSNILALQDIILKEYGETE